MLGHFARVSLSPVYLGLIIEALEGQVKILEWEWLARKGTSGGMTCIGMTHGINEMLFLSAIVNIYCCFFLSYSYHH